jgi:hypothetical protein
LKGVHTHAHTHAHTARWTLINASLPLPLATQHNQVEDNFFDVAPGVVFFGVMLYAALDLKKSIDLHHRD